MTKKRHRKKRVKPTDLSAPKNVVRYGNTFGRFFSLLTFIAALLGIYIERPKIIITPETTTIKAMDAFRVPFEIANAGDLISLKDIHAGCDGSATYKVRASGTTRPKIRVVIYSWPQLEPGRSFSTYCDFTLETGNIPLEVSEIDIKMKITYDVRFCPWRQTYERLFMFAKTPDGQFHWLPNG